MIRNMFYESYTKGSKLSMLGMAYSDICAIRSTDL